MKLMFSVSQANSARFRGLRDRFAARAAGGFLATWVAAGLTAAGAGAAEDSGSALRVAQEFHGARAPLRAFALSELNGLKQSSSRERDRDGGEATWKGVSLGHLIEEAMKSLSVEQRAQIDLVILRNAAGQQALVPRSFIVKYPMLLATSRNGKGLGAQGPLYSVPPWTSRAARIAREGLPVETYFVPGVSEIELTNFQSRFGSYFLKRRTDPAAVRGEKLFVHSCATCHGAGQGPGLQTLTGEEFVAKVRALSSGGHPPVPGFLQPSKRDGRALNQYLDALKRTP